MPACNIDAKGRAVRLVTGLVSLVGAIVVAVLVLTAVMPAWGWAVAIGAAVGGGFAVYEGWAGWCALRAIGVKTPM
ncbi:MAG: hypothetical protein AAGI68_16480 [Planctomycetota bacterium]